MEPKREYPWLNNKSSDHSTKISAALRGNKNALKSGEYARFWKDSYFCNTCAAASNCPKHQKDAVCGYKKWGEVETRTYDEAVRAMQDVMKVIGGRLLRGLYFEGLEGGSPEKEVTRLLEDCFKMNVQMMQFMQENEKSDKMKLNRDNPLYKIFGNTR